MKIKQFFFTYNDYEVKGGSLVRLCFDPQLQSVELCDTSGPWRRDNVLLSGTFLLTVSAFPTMAEPVI